MKNGISKLCVAVIGLSFSAMPLPVRAAPATTPTTTAASTQARTAQQIAQELNASGKELQEIIGSKGPHAFTDEKIRKEIAPKAIPALKKNLALFEEFTAYEPGAKMQEVTVRTQFLALMATLGDADSQNELTHLAAGKGEDAVAAQDALLMSQWWQTNGDAQKQKKILDQAIALLKDNPKIDGPALTLMEMANTGAANPDLKHAAQDAVVANAQGPQGKTMATQLQAAQKLKTMENKPLELSGATVDGKTFSTADWKGKVILVDFWATWCGPCRAELPKVKKAYADFHAKGLEVLGVSCDNSADDLKAFLKENPDMPWPQLFDEKTPGWHPLATKFGIDGIPTMFLIDKKGILHSVEAREDFEEQIPKLLAE